MNLSKLGTFVDFSGEEPGAPDFQRFSNLPKITWKACDRAKVCVPQQRKFNMILKTKRTRPEVISEYENGVFVCLCIYIYNWEWGIVLCYYKEVKFPFLTFSVVLVFYKFGLVDFFKLAALTG